MLPSFWFCGRPGCSSSLAVLFENGPFKVTSDAGTTLAATPYSWNTVANVIYIDQPVGTGYSYSSSPTSDDTNELQVGEEVYQFLMTWFKRFPQFIGRKFFVTGESYGGHCTLVMGICCCYVASIRWYSDIYM